MKRTALIYKKQNAAEASDPERSPSPCEAMVVDRSGSNGSMSSHADAMEELRKAQAMWGHSSPQKSTSKIRCQSPAISIAASTNEGGEYDDNIVEVGTHCFKL